MARRLSIPRILHIGFFSAHKILQRLVDCLVERRRPVLGQRLFPAPVGAGASSDPAAGDRFNDYAQRLCSGDPRGEQGIALGWRHLAERLLASGLLVPTTMTTGKGFHVIWPRNSDLTENARKVRDWQAAQA
jgi:DNA-binding transcriptional LysR family regulator